MYYNILETFENSNTDYGLTKLSDGGPLTYRGIPVTEETTWAKDNQRLQSCKRNPLCSFGNLENLHVGTDIAKPWL